MSARKLVLWVVVDKRGEIWESSGASLQRTAIEAYLDGFSIANTESAKWSYWRRRGYRCIKLVEVSKYDR